MTALTAVALSACATPIAGSFSPVSSSSAASSSSASSSAASASSTSPSAIPSATPTTGPDAGAAGAVPAASGGAAAQAPAKGSAPAPSGGGQGSGGGNSGPAVTSFSASKPTCQPGASAELTLRWSVTGADGAVLAVDGLGEYGSFGPTGSTTLTIPCDGNAHTYNLWPSGHQDARRSITVKPDQKKAPQPKSGTDGSKGDPKKSGAQTPAT